VVKFSPAEAQGRGAWAEGNAFLNYESLQFRE